MEGEWFDESLGSLTGETHDRPCIATVWVRYFRGFVDVFGLAGRSICFARTIPIM